MNQKTLLELLRKIIYQETTYLRHYLGKVTKSQDPEKRGRVRVTIQELGWDTDAKGAWVTPRITSGMVTPKEGQFVEVYFLNGDRERPVFVGLAKEMQESGSTLFKGDINVQVPWEDAVNQEGVAYDRNEKVMKFFGASEFAAMGASNKDFLTTLVNDLNTFITNVFNVHTHISATPGAPTAVPVPISKSPLSTPTDSLVSTKVKIE